MQISNKSCNFAPSNKKKQLKNDMKNETKKKIAAVSAGFGLVTLNGTAAFVAIEHPAQWYVAVASILAIGVAFFTICTID